MIYFTVKDELEHMKSLLNSFEKIIAIEKNVRNQVAKKGTEFIGPYDMFIAIRKDQYSS